MKHIGDFGLFVGSSRWFADRTPCLCPMPAICKGPLLRYAAPVPMAGLLAAALATIPQPAFALSWQWRFDRIDAPIVEASGELITSDSPDAEGWYTITGITGERNQVTITSFIPTGSPIPGNCQSVDHCYTSDNLLRPVGAKPQLTGQGFGVGFADNTYANYFFADFWEPLPSYVEFYSAPPFGFLPPGPEDSELPGVFHASPVPGPGPLAAAWLGWSWSRQLRRRQRAGR